MITKKKYIVLAFSLNIYSYNPHVLLDSLAQGARYQKYVYSRNARFAATVAGGTTVAAVLLARYYENDSEKCKENLSHISCKEAADIAILGTASGLAAFFAYRIAKHKKSAELNTLLKLVRKANYIGSSVAIAPEKHVRAINELSAKKAVERYQEIHGWHSKELPALAEYFDCPRYRKLQDCFEIWQKKCGIILLNLESNKTFLEKRVLLTHQSKSE